MPGFGWTQSISLPSGPSRNSYLDTLRASKSHVATEREKPRTKSGNLRSTSDHGAWKVEEIAYARITHARAENTLAMVDRHFAVYPFGSFRLIDRVSAEYDRIKLISRKYVKRVNTTNYLQREFYGMNGPQPTYYDTCSCAEPYYLRQPRETDHANS